MQPAAAAEAVSPTELVTPLPILPSQTPAEPGGEGRWRAGSLAYTRRGLTVLFFCLLGGVILKDYLLHVNQN